MTTLEINELLKNEDLKAADQLCDRLRSRDPENKTLKELQRSIHEKITTAAMPGPSYLEWLRHLHTRLKPRSYMEIGVETGQSLRYAEPGTFAIGVDPEPRIVYGFNAWSRLYKMTSDDFFANHNPYHIFGRYIDLCFIDGLHYYDQVLRDFINVEKYSSANTYIFMHDVAPAVAATATREWTTTYWAGDTWKIMPILAKYRPDLTIATIPAYPTGLGVVTNLDPKSTVLSDNYDVIVAEMLAADFADYQPVNLIINNFENLPK